MQQIEWDGIKFALSGIPLRVCTKVTKYMYQWWPTSTILASQARSPDPMCQVCKTCHETNDHLWRCDRTKSVRELLWVALMTQTEEAGTAPWILAEWDWAGCKMLQINPPYRAYKMHVPDLAAQYLD